MANTIVITPEEVYRKSPLNRSTDIEMRIADNILLAKDEIDNRLNNLYDPTEHGKELQYRTAICLYVYYLLVPTIPLIELSGVGRLSEDDEIDRDYISQATIDKVRARTMSDIDSYISTIQAEMEDDGEDLDEPAGVTRVGGLVIIDTGGNDDYITNYGDGLQSNDDDLREVEYE